MDRRQLLIKGTTAGAGAVALALGLAPVAHASDLQQIDELAAQIQTRANDMRDNVAMLPDSDEKETLEYDAQQVLELAVRIGELTGHPSQ